MSTMEGQAAITEALLKSRDESPDKKLLDDSIGSESESESENENETESDNQSQRGICGEACDSSKYPNPKKLTGYELKRALKITCNAECLFHSGTLSKEELDGEISRAWKLNEENISPTRKRKKASTRKSQKDIAPSIPVRRSKRKVKPSSSPFLRRSTRKTKEEATTEAMLFSQVLETNEDSHSKKLATNIISDRGAADSPAADSCWSPKEHRLFVEGLQHYIKEQDWRKIAVHVETKTAKEVRIYATLAQMNRTQGPSQEISQLEKVAELNGTVNQTEQFEAADEMAKIVNHGQS